MKQRHQQKKTQYSTYESRENLDSFSFSLLSEISQTEHARPNLGRTFFCSEYRSTIKQHAQPTFVP